MSWEYNYLCNWIASSSPLEHPVPFSAANNRTPNWLKQQRQYFQPKRSTDMTNNKLLQYWTITFTSMRAWNTSSSKEAVLQLIRSIEHIKNDIDLIVPDKLLSNESVNWGLRGKRCNGDISLPENAFDLRIRERSEIHSPLDSAPSLALLLVAALPGEGIIIGIAARVAWAELVGTRCVGKAQPTGPIVDITASRGDCSSIRLAIAAGFLRQRHGVGR